MTTTQSQLAGRRTGAAPLPPATGHAGFTGALRSEFTKIRSTRSTYWTLLAMIVITIGFGALASGGAANSGNEGPAFDPTQQSLFGLFFGQLVIAVLGALTITSEYATGMIRTSLTAQPRRGTLLAAKATVFAAVALVTGLITCFGAFFLGQALMSGAHMGTSIAAPGVLRAVVGGALFLTACGMLAFGLGAILRHTAGAITAAIVLLFVLSILVNALPHDWQAHVDKWMPAIAGSQIWAVVPVKGFPPMLAPWTGFAVLCGYALVALAGGLILVRRRDA
ncbi:MAG TPA: ABC transporter permease subunit [Streptosporangiaceae bacterium]|jgi:ABC-type transport system involved in multi-copper enzyme maturation permease subunit